MQPPSIGCLCPGIHWRLGSQGCTPGWPAFPSSQSTRVLACVDVSSGMSVHGHEWVWMRVGARGWIVLPPAEMWRIGGGVLWLA